MGEHDGLRLAGDIGGLELLGADVTAGGVVIQKHRDGPELDDRGNGGGKTRRHRDDLVARLDTFVGGQLVRGQGGKGHQIGGGTGVDQQAVLYAEERGEFLLERLALGPKR